MVELIDHEFEYLVAGADGAGHGAGVDAGIPANRTQCSQDKGLEKSNNSTEADKDWWPQNLGLAGLNQPLREVIEVNEVPQRNEIRLEFNFTLDSSLNSVENFDRVITKGVENSVIASAIAGASLTLTVTPFDQGMVEIQYFDKTPGLDDQESLRRLCGLDLASVYLTPTAIKFILHSHQNSPNPLSKNHDPPLSSNQLLARHSVIGPN